MTMTGHLLLDGWTEIYEAFIVIFAILSMIWRD